MFELMTGAVSVCHGRVGMSKDSMRCRLSLLIFVFALFDFAS